jgi:hypothetical protein
VAAKRRRKGGGVATLFRAPRGVTGAGAPVKITIEVTGPVYDALCEMQASGLYGRTLAGIVEELLRTSIRGEMLKGSIHR